MSGGRFNYDQYKIGYIADSIERSIEDNGRLKSEDELNDERWARDTINWYKEHPEDLYHYKYREEVIERFKLAVHYLRIAQVYAHRVDWLLSGDDGESSFIERLNEDLVKLRQKELLSEMMESDQNIGLYD